MVKAGNTTPGKAGLWLFQIGDQQEFGDFELSPTPFDPPKIEATGKVDRLLSGEFKAPPLPSPQDWVLVLERVKP